MADEIPPPEDNAAVCAAKVAPFSYVYIPCDDKESASLMRFDGTSDEELRNRLTAHFRKQVLTRGQVAEFQDSLKAKLTSEGNRVAVQQMLAEVAENTTFEIVPVTMPSLQNGFIGSSLYIDDAGSYKDLPMNPRASRMAQRPIKGDAFLLSNHDDPAADDWSRVDTTLATYELLLASPPGAIDTSNQRQMAICNQQRESNLIVVTPEALSTAEGHKAEGNRLVAAGDWALAAAAYHAGIEAMAGRTDKLTNESDAIRLRATLYGNRSLCGISMGQWGDAKADAQQSLHWDASNKKVHYRLATALMRLGEFEAGRQALAACVACGATEAELAGLRQQMDDLEREQKQRERSAFKKMFGL